MEIAIRQKWGEREIEDLKPCIQAASDLLFRMTGGTLYLQRVLLRNGLDDRTCKLILDRDRDSMPYSPTSIGPGCWSDRRLLLHEIAHVIFGLPDEYPNGYEAVRPPTCTVCLMAGPEGSEAFCHPSNHVGAGPSCEERIVSLFPMARAGFDCRREGKLSDPPPRVEFNVENRARDR